MSYADYIMWSGDGVMKSYFWQAFINGYVDYIIALHEDHDENAQYSNCPMCRAIQAGVPDEQIVAIAEEVDPDIRAAYKSHCEKKEVAYEADINRCPECLQD
jgi:hypothetical protein